MTQIIYVVYTKEYLTLWQITGANLKKYAFLCDYSEVKIDDLIDSPMYSTPMPTYSLFMGTQIFPSMDTFNVLSFSGINCDLYFSIKLLNIDFFSILLEF
jgi:hypothetical protein